ncbi:MAG TPA: glycosyltransferase family 2 protein [Ferruginibacter sp.]|nr:glycosyltransferase family 2 protein [Ferruginibacter sp.]HPH91759.1 glycosyltransferase family 2 protein [Ferruginibacter sp.]
MKISGFTIVRNAVKNDYPVVEAIRSILPVVDEMIVSIDRGEDNSEDLIKSIVSDKIKIVYSEWDMSLKEGGQVYALETNKAKAHASPGSDWLFYIQADEVVHEKYHAAILAAANKYKDDTRVEGFLFGYLHFYGTYDYVGDSRSWYNYEIRMIRNNKNISSYKDAQSFRRGNEKLNVVQIDVLMYHYGWVKSPKQMMDKHKEIVKYYHEEGKVVEYFKNAADVFDFDQFDSIKKFTGTHPSVMQERIANKNWHVELDENKKRFSFKDRLLFWFEKKTGIRLFAFKNYRRIKG